MSAFVQETTCACGEPATANGWECPEHYRKRLRSVFNGYTPSRSNGFGQIDPHKSRRWDNRLEDYRSVRMEGSQPRGTKRRDIEEAKRLSDQLQTPFRADAKSRGIGSA